MQQDLSEHQSSRNKANKSRWDHPKENIHDWTLNELLARFEFQDKSDKRIQAELANLGIEKLLSDTPLKCVYCFHKIMIYFLF